MSILLTAGGDFLLDTAFDQGAGLASAASVSLSGVGGCTDTMQFIATCVTGTQNTAIAAINQDPTYDVCLTSKHSNGVIWGRGIQQQGYPYENDVTCDRDQRFVQTSEFFPVFDQWRRSQGTAVSDEIINTQGSSYLANPGRITVMMDKWAKKMLSFVLGTGGGLTINKSQIKTYDFDLGVPSTTTAPQWTAICAGRQDMVSDFSAAGKTCSIIIHSIT